MARDVVVVADRLSLTFGALADPTRRAILARLAGGEATVGELAEPFDISLPAISRHLKVLERAGLITRGKRAQWRPVRLEPTPLIEVDSWLAEYREVWESRFDRLDEYLRVLQEQRLERDGEQSCGNGRAIDEDSHEDRDES